MPRKKSTAKAVLAKPVPKTVAIADDQLKSAAVKPHKSPKAAITTKQKPKKATKPIHPKAQMSFRRNVLPPVLGILIFLGVLGLLNGQWLQAQYQYRYAKPTPLSNFTASPTTTDPNAPAHIYIPRINVSAPIVTDVKTYDASSVQLGLRRGPVQYGTSVNPGQKGNIVIVGHSSGQLWAPGNYKFVFTLLDKMVTNDRIIIDFKGIRYIYRVDTTKIVTPTDLSVLKQTDDPELTLITCTPVGTSKNRRVVTARQVSPKPETAVTVDKIAPPPAMTIPN